MTVEVESCQAARQIIPLAFRHQARVVEMGRFSMEEVETALLQHEASRRVTAMPG
jgi:hypothetical protein